MKKKSSQSIVPFQIRLAYIYGQSHTNHFRERNGCVFMLWGEHAKKKAELIDSNRHKVIKCAHPSPLSSHGFFNSKCFSIANAYLKSMGKSTVNWSLK
jgi:uracil-DNA glycosylase